MENIGDNELKVLNQLFKSKNGLDIFTLYQRLDISTEQLFSCLENLQNVNLISSNFHKVKITDEGYVFVIKHSSRRHKNTKALEKGNYDGERIEIDSFYIPTRFKLNK